MVFTPAPRILAEATTASTLPLANSPASPNAALAFSAWSLNDSWNLAVKSVVLVLVAILTVSFCGAGAFATGAGFTASFGTVTGAGLLLVFAIAAAGFALTTGALRGAAGFGAALGAGLALSSAAAGAALRGRPRPRLICSETG